MPCSRMHVPRPGPHEGPIAPGCPGPRPVTKAPNRAAQAPPQTRETKKVSLSYHAGPDHPELGRTSVETARTPALRAPPRQRSTVDDALPRRRFRSGCDQGRRAVPARSGRARTMSAHRSGVVTSRLDSIRRGHRRPTHSRARRRSRNHRRRRSPSGSPWGTSPGPRRRSDCKRSRQGRTSILPPTR